jgi:hypothetical protein
MLHAMQVPRQQPAKPRPARRKVVVPAAVRRPVTPVQRHAFGLPEVREIPRRSVAGPWEAGW